MIPTWTICNMVRHKNSGKRHFAREVCSSMENSCNASTQAHANIALRYSASNVPLKRHSNSLISVHIFHCDDHIQSPGVRRRTRLVPNVVKWLLRIERTHNTFCCMGCLKTGEVGLLLDPELVYRIVKRDIKKKSCQNPCYLRRIFKHYYPTLKPKCHFDEILSLVMRKL